MKEFMNNFKQFSRFNQCLLGFMILMDVGFLISSAFVVADLIEKHESALTKVVFTVVSAGILTLFIFMDKALYNLMKIEAQRRIENQ